MQPHPLPRVPFGVETVRVTGASLHGTGAELVTVEGQFEPRDRSATEVVITGLPDPVIRESRGRLLCVLRENRLHLGPGRLHLNLVPAARPKSGEILDLPLVLAAVGAGGHVPPSAFRGALFLGEVGIDGTLHAVPGGLAAALAARRAGLFELIAPPATAREAAVVPELRARGASHVARVLAHLADEGAPLALERALEETADESQRPRSLEEIRGQTSAKHALAVAAAGAHALLFIGPPGAGKSMLARHLIDLLPPPSLEERLEITSVLSAAGRWPGGLVARRPYRAPHHTVSYAGLVGGGPSLAPGEITLAHRGVLFLDELPEFRREVLEALRQPLEEGQVWISRAGRQVELPCAFHLVAAMNPCPCGYRGHPRVPCVCPASGVRRYRQRISGPLLDRIDLRVEVAPAPVEVLARPPGRADAGGGDAGWDELAVALRRAEDLRASRGQRPRNAQLAPSELERWAPLDPESRELLTLAAERRSLSARALQSLRRVARTLADLEGGELPGALHLGAALGLRAPLAT